MWSPAVCGAEDRCLSSFARASVTSVVEFKQVSLIIQGIIQSWNLKFRSYFTQTVFSFFPLSLLSPSHSPSRPWWSLYVHFACFQALPVTSIREIKMFLHFEKAFVKVIILLHCLEEKIFWTKMIFCTTYLFAEGHISHYFSWPIFPSVAGNLFWSLDNFFYLWIMN